MSNTGNIGYESGRDLVIEMCDRMRLARMKAGLEQVEIAEMMGISASTVSNWENGRTTPRAPDLNYWAQLTGFNLSSLIPPAEAKPEGGKFADDVEDSPTLRGR